MKLLPAALTLALFALPVEAAAPSRVWISNHGVDTDACGPVATPCRTAQYAHDKVASGGEIDVLDGGGYGAVTITKSVSIVNEGAGVATLTAPAYGAAVKITTTGGVLLRGLHLDGGAHGFWGVNMLAGRSLEVSRCSIESMIQSAVTIYVKDDVTFTIRDTDISFSGSAVTTSAAQNMYGLIERVNVSESWIALLLLKDPASKPGYLSQVTARELSINLGPSGQEAVKTTGPELSLLDSRVVVGRQHSAVASGFVTGVHANGGKVHLAKTAITGADVAVRIDNGGVVDSAGDNLFLGNVRDVDGVLGSVSRK